MTDKLEPAIWAIFGFFAALNPFIGSGFGAAAMYVHNVSKNKENDVVVKEFIYTVLLGLFVGYVSNDLAVGIGELYPDTEAAHVLNVLHDPIIAASGFLSPKLLNIIEGINLREVGQWFMRK
jgi:hypothetical protein